MPRNHASRPLSEPIMRRLPICRNAPEVVDGGPAVGT